MAKLSGKRSVLGGLIAPGARSSGCSTPGDWGSVGKRRANPNAHSPGGTAPGATPLFEGKDATCQQQGGNRLAGRHTADSRKDGQRGPRSDPDRDLVHIVRTSRRKRSCPSSCKPVTSRGAFGRRSVPAPALRGGPSRRRRAGGSNTVHGSARVAFRCATAPARHRVRPPALSKL